MSTAATLRTATPLLVAFTLAVTWTYLTRHMYNYNQDFDEVLELNLFPLIGWTFALTTGYFVMRFILKLLKVRSTLLRFLIVTIVFCAMVVTVEAAGYHLFNIHNLGTNQYAGLPLCDCLHAPSWMQAGYFLLGPTHWVLTAVVLAIPSVLLKKDTTTVNS